MSSVWPAANEKILTDPFEYLKHIPGKDLRTLFIEAFNTVLDVPPDKLEVIANVVNTLHTASLLVDDVEDGAALRRGLPTAHTVYGIGRTVNTSSYMVFVALDAATRQLGTVASATIIEEMLNMHRGQGLDIYWREALLCPTEEEYIAMVANKTGGLLRLAVRLMQEQSPRVADPRLLELAETMGVLYQIQDDLLNLTSPEYTRSKGLCEDITEGKFSFPVIHSIRNAVSSDRRLLDILEQRPRDVALKRQALDILRSTGSLEYSKDRVLLYAKAANRCLEVLSKDGTRTKQLVKLVDTMTMVK